MYSAIFFFSFQSISDLFSSLSPSSLPPFLLYATLVVTYYLNDSKLEIQQSICTLSKRLTLSSRRLEVSPTPSTEYMSMISIKCQLLSTSSTIIDLGLATNCSVPHFLICKNILMILTSWHCCENKQIQNSAWSTVSLIFTDNLMIKDLVANAVKYRQFTWPFFHSFISVVPPKFPEQC